MQLSDGCFDKPIDALAIEDAERDADEEVADGIG